jgi:branched-subunit amino acid ABC-type transport system permease component
LVNGVSVGCVYALLAVSFWVIFAATRTFHLAHAAVLTTSGYVMYVLHSVLDVPFLLAVLGAALWAALLGGAMELFVYRPTRRAGGSGLLLFVAATAMLTLGTAAVALIFSEEPKGLGSSATVLIENPVVITDRDVWAVVATVIVVAGFVFVLGRTRWGRALRASMDNPRLAQCLAINVKRVYVASFMIGSALAVLPLTIMALAAGVNPAMGLEPTLIAFVAVIVGGLRSFVGALVAGFALGLLENVMLLWLSASWQDVLIFGVLFAVLIFFPQGLRAAPTIRAHTAEA